MQKWKYQMKAVTGKEEVNKQGSIKTRATGNYNAKATAGKITLQNSSKIGATAKMGSVAVGATVDIYSA